MFVYILKSKNRRFRYKIGISKNPRQRVKTVAEPSTLVFALPVIGSAWLERYLHRRYNHLRRPIKGNGGTEWFYFWVPFRPILWVVVFFTAQVLLAFVVINFCIYR